MQIFSYPHQSSLKRRVASAVIVITFLGCTTTNKKVDPSKDAALKEKYPMLTKPEVRSIWVDDAIDGNKFIEGHRVYILERGSGWTK